MEKEKHERSRHCSGIMSEAVTTVPATGALLVSLSFLLTGMAYQNPDKPITCQASTSHEDAVATVTCDFHLDLNVTKRDFIVSYFRTPKDDDPYIFLSCNWHQKPMPTCYVEDNVNFNMVVTRNLTIKVRSQIAQVGGEFMCELVPTAKSEAEKCLLNFSEPTTESATTTESAAKTTSGCLPCDGGGSGASVAAAVIVTFLLTAGTCTVVYIFLLRKRNVPLPDCLQWLRKQHSPGQEGEVNSPTSGNTALDEVPNRRSPRTAHVSDDAGKPLNRSDQEGTTSDAEVANSGGEPLTC
ncbi:uncharacterized protein LOC143277298 isoform X2 [Babylonia areolata]|uniref:uncharacterized protein LOC143277298 isoform X2 n=1 Tax=Babylonia areolata TaxID=304850 RepID=UPI003FD08AB1